MILRLIPTLALAVMLSAGCASTGPDATTTPSLPDVSTASDDAVDALDPGVDIPVVNPDSYILGQGDEISIQVFDEPDLTLSTVVSTGGSINYSYLGDLKVAGKSPVQLEQHIAGLLKNGYLVNPSVNVRVIQYRPFFINGEVRSPGSYSYQPGLTLDRAIALAGGLTDRASTRKMFVTKADDKDAEEKRVPLSFRIQPGDTITIKEGFF